MNDFEPSQYGGFKAVCYKAFSKLYFSTGAPNEIQVSQNTAVFLLLIKKY